MTHGGRLILAGGTRTEMTTRVYAPSSGNRRRA